MDSINSIHMSNKSEYRQLCESEPTIPLFSRDWWMDATCGEENWDVALVQVDGEVKGSFPYLIVRKYGQTVITMPKLSQFMGPWIKRSENVSYGKQLTSEAEVITKLIDSLPHFNYFNQNIHYSITNWLPFYWKGFHQTTQYTNIIPDLTDLDKVYADFEKDVVRRIKQAQKVLRVSTSEDITKFYEVNIHVFKKQDINVPYSFDYVKRLDSACQKKGCRRIFMARDESDQVHAVLYLVWYEESAYILMSGIDPQFKDEGAMKLLIWEAMKFSQSVTKQFDFEGSMLKPVDTRNRRFSPIQVPYSNITKANGFATKLLESATHWSTSPRLMRWLEQRL